jgi:GDSL-like Lipase/Acylhydrolase family
MTTTTITRPPTVRRPVRRVLRVLAVVGTLVVVTAAAIAFALRVTPPQPVSALGQTVEVGATTLSLSASGPGEIVLFGQALPTVVEFVGPVRPRVVLTDISLNAQLTDAFSPPGRGAAAAAVGEALAAGWRRYFVWQSVFVALAAVVLLGAIAGWRRYGARKTLLTVVGGLLFVEVVNLSAIMVTAFTAPDVLRDVGSLQDLVGREERRPIAAAPGPAQPGVEAIVMGDSTAAGLGGPPLPEPTSDDEACQRSAFAFAETLARVNEWNVRNLACSGAMIDRGILRSQFTGGREIEPQLALAKQVVVPEAVIVSVGANDMRWSTHVRLCAIQESCDDRGSTLLFQRSLDKLTRDYYELLRQLARLPGDPIVLINQYYVPFDPELDCLADLGLTPEKVEVLLSRLDALNAVLANGAETFGYLSVAPSFEGHELCTDQSYVQGFEDEAPLHPNARGQLVIALADERALLEAAP